VTATVEAPAKHGLTRTKGMLESSAGGSAVAIRFLYAFSALMIWAVLYALVFGALQETRSQSVMYAKFRQEIAPGYAGKVAPIGAPIKPGAPVALLEIPRLGLRDVVVEGTSSGDLLKGPGHRADSPFPGEAGVSVIYGRAATFGAPFGRLQKLQPGDAITVVDGAGTFRYVVKDVRRAGSPLPQPIGANASRLTLASAAANGWRAVLAPSAPLYVDADMQGPVGAEPGGRPAVVPASEKLMGIDSGALNSLVHWLALFGLTAAAAAWAFARWGRWQTWIVAVPTVGATLWLVSETAMKLLPNAL
jgi:sortase A